MGNITYLISKSKMSYFEILRLPYAVFLSLLKHFRLFDIKSTPEGMELLAKSERLYETEPDLDNLRNSGFYQKG